MTEAMGAVGMVEREWDMVKVDGKGHAWRLGARRRRRLGCNEGELERKKQMLLAIETEARAGLPGHRGSSNERASVGSKASAGCANQCDRDARSNKSDDFRI